MITVYQCVDAIGKKENGHHLWAISSERPHVAPMCPTCNGNNVRVVARLANTTDADAFNKTHAAWLDIVDRITRRWLVAEVAYCDSHQGTAAMAFTDVNEERRQHGLHPLTWEDVSHEAEKL